MPILRIHYDNGATHLTLYSDPADPDARRAAVKPIIDFPNLHIEGAIVARSNRNDELVVEVRLAAALITIVPPGTKLN